MFGETTTVISVGERESLEVIDKGTKHAKALQALGSQWATIEGEKVDSLRLASGGRVLALPSTSGGRSYSGNVLLDEFAYHTNPQKVWDGASAVVMHGYRMRVLSTPNGVGNLFHELWTDPKASSGYTKHATTIDEARADGLRVDDAECWKMARGDPRVYDQLFRCSFLATGRDFFDGLLIAKQLRALLAPVETLTVRHGGAQGTLRIWHPPKPGCRYVVAVDTSEGTGGDAGCAVVFERGTGRHMATLWGQFQPWELARAAAGVGKRYGHPEVGALIVVERTGNHGPACLRALDAEQNYRNIFHDRDDKPGWLNTQPSRASALDALEQAHRSETFRTHDENILGEMRTFIVNDKGKPEAAPGTHDDLVMATAIGWDAVCRQETQRNLTYLPPR